VRITRVFLPQSLVRGESIQINDESAHYMLTVLRLKIGYSLVVFNGEGGEYQATITDLGRKKSLTLLIGEYQPGIIESSIHTTLAIGISRGERMDYAVQKAVELGVTTITPLLTEYCVVKLNTQQAERRHRHWQRILEHACEQCGRTVVPHIDHPVNLIDWLAQPRQGCRLLFHPDKSQKLEQVATVDQHFYLLVGPEGGFSSTECAHAIDTGFQPVNIGPRVLRTETAVVAALTSIQLRWGDF
jgi:16S rRNA (uracil1498-N3)-methyltransferase